MSEKAKSRNQIVETASRLFFCQGYAGTGLNQIVKESQSPKGSLYYYFPDGKEELALECIHHNKQLVIEKIKGCLLEAPHSVEAIQMFIDEIIQDAEQSEYHGYTPFSFWMAVETSSISEKLRDGCQSVFQEWQELFASGFIRDGIEADRARELGTLVVSFIEGALILSLTTRSKQPLLSAAKHIPVLVRGK